MSLAKKLVWLTAVQIITRVFSIALGVFLVYQVLHYLDPSNYGRYSLVLSVLQIVVTLADFGLYLIATKHIAGKDARESGKYFSSIITFRIASAFVFMFALLALVPFLRYDHTVKLGIVLTSIMIISLSTNQVLMSVFQKYHRTNSLAIIELCAKAAMVVFTQLSIMYGLGIYYLLQAISVATLMQMVALLVLAYRQSPFRFELSRESIVQVWKQSWPLALSVIFTTVFFRGDSIALSLLRPVADVGVYNAAFRILETLSGFPILFVGLVLPYLASTFGERNLSGFTHYFRRAFDAVIVITFPMVTGFVVLSSQVIRFIAGAAYHDSAHLLQILMVGTGLIYLIVLPAHAITLIGKQKLMMYFYLVAALVAVAGYYMFIPRYGYWAAAWTMVAAQMVVFISAQTIVTATTGALPRLATVVRCSLACGVMALAMALMMARVPMPFYVTAAVGGVVYGACALALRVVPLDEVREWLAPLKRRGV